MNILTLINLIFSPILWIGRKIVNHIQRKALLDYQREKDGKDRVFEAEQREKDRELVRFQEEEKTKRLEKILNSNLELAQVSYNNHPDSINELIFIRRVKKRQKDKIIIVSYNFLINFKNLWYYKL